MAKTASELSPGTVIDGKYRLDRLLAMGGMGEVYEATQIAIDRKVAVKTLRPEHVDNEHSVARFHQEARIAGSLGHDHICEVTDLGTHDGTVPYLVMPLLSGITLRDLLQKPSVSILRVVDILMQVLSALSRAHQANIIHRDLKPSNVFITTFSKQDDVVKLLDFGISKIISSERASQLTKTGSVSGTSFYMSPEQACGSKQVDHRTDIYSAGVLLYEALTQRRPFQGDSHNEILHRIISDSFVLPRKINPSIPASLERVVLKAMSRDPQKRYASADDMLGVLERAAADCSEDIDTGRPSDENSGDDQTAGETDLISQWSITSNDPLSQGNLFAGERPSKKRRRMLFVPLGILLISAIFVIGYVLLGGDRPPDAIPAPDTQPQLAPTRLETETPDAPERQLKAQADNAADAPVQMDAARPVEVEKKEAAPAAPAAAVSEVPKRKPLKKRKRRNKKRKGKEFGPDKPLGAKNDPEQENKSQPKKAKGRFGTEVFLEYDEN